VQLEGEAGVETASRWYRREATRTAFSLLRTLAIEPGDAARVIALVVAAYVVAVRAAGPLTDAIAAALGTPSGTSFTAINLTAVAATGGVAAVVVRSRRAARVAHSTPVVGSVLLLGMALGVGAVHVAMAPPAEHWFRVAKVSVFLFAIVAGSISRWPTSGYAHEAPSP
jgi:hypothetical protein